MFSADQGDVILDIYLQCKLLHHDDSEDAVGRLGNLVALAGELEINQEVVQKILAENVPYGLFDRLATSPQ